MAAFSLAAIHQYFPEPNQAQVHASFLTTSSRTISRRRKAVAVRCSSRTAMERFRQEKNQNYYDLLGVSVDSSSQEIKEAYRKLQKKHHPDIAGEKGHEYTLMLNEAYKVLMKEDLRRDYDASIHQVRVPFGFGRNKSKLGYSSWNGPIRPEALFVDENACIGCRECVHNASNTFVMDEDLGCARVKVQYGDNHRNLEVSVDSCPVNCIHWVDKEELEVLEFLIRPQPKEGYGVFGGGWERPTNVFSAAKAFIKQMEHETSTRTNAKATAEEETPAQAEARARASMRIKMERFPGLWSLLGMFGLNKENDGEQYAESTGKERKS